MKEPLSKVLGNIRLLSKTSRPYKELRKHLDRQPVGYPATPSGVELRILKELFTVEEAEAALNLGYKFEPSEVICARAGQKECDQNRISRLLESMEKKGCIIGRHTDSQRFYALHPFVLGFFEAAVKRLTPGLYVDVRRFYMEGFAMEYLTTQVPQMRVIPINKSLAPALNVATYDRIREIVERSKGRIAVSDCICKKGKDLIGNPCTVTDRREICLYLGDYADSSSRNGWARHISKDEAVEILDRNEKDGLVLMPSSMQEPHVVCACCDCCCGAMEVIKTMPRPVDFAASNYFARFNPETCTGCKACMKRCQMEAILFDEEAQKATGINDRRCIGCGLCVPTCKAGSISLVKKDDEFIPPRDLDAFNDHLMQNKKGLGGKLARMARAIVGMKV
jgi:Na+-translocating ferredoxin:NAD+ oxidoreductase subunit B